jgi:hypothetical protein
MEQSDTACAGWCGTVSGPVAGLSATSPVASTPAPGVTTSPTTPSRAQQRARETPAASASGQRAAGTTRARRMPA